MTLKIVAELPAHRRFAGALRLDAEGRTVAGPFPVRGGIATPLGTYRVGSLLRASDDGDARRFGPMQIRILPIAGAETGGGASEELAIHGGALGHEGRYPETAGGIRLSDEDMQSLLEAIGDSATPPDLCEVSATPVELVDLAGPETDPKRQLLFDLGAAEVAHSRDALFDHLEGTHALLLSWGAREELCDAGLFHSVYGTETFQHPGLTIALRDRVQKVIGLEAEEIVYINHVKDTQSFLGSAVAWQPGEEVPQLLCRFTGDAIACGERSFFDLIHLTLANALEQAPRVPQYYGVAEQRFYRSLLRLAPDGARADFERLFGGAE